MIECEQEGIEHFGQINADTHQEIEDNGVEFITFTPEDTEWYHDLANQAKWEKLEANPDVSPESIAKLKSFLVK